MLLIISINGLLQGINFSSIYVYGGKQYNYGQGGVILTFASYLGSGLGSIIAIV